MRRVFPLGVVLIFFFGGLFIAAVSGTAFADNGITAPTGLKFDQTVKIPSFLSVSGQLEHQSSHTIINQAVLGVVFRSALNRGIWCSPVTEWFTFARYVANTWYPPAGNRLSDLVYRRTHTRNLQN